MATKEQNDRIVSVQLDDKYRGLIDELCGFTEQTISDVLRDIIYTRLDAYVIERNDAIKQMLGQKSESQTSMKF